MVGGWSRPWLLSTAFYPPSSSTSVKHTRASGSKFSASGSLKVILSGPRRRNINLRAQDSWLPDRSVAIPIERFCLGSQIWGVRKVFLEIKRYNLKTTGQFRFLGGQERFIRLLVP